MPFDAHLFVGLDLCAGRKPLTYAAFERSGRLAALGSGNLEAVLAYLDGLPAALLAVNAPAGPNLGLVRRAGRALNLRLAEYQLRQRGLAVAMTPASPEACPGWVQTGFEFYRRLTQVGFRAYSPAGGQRLWLETHPQATFSALLEQLPLPRATLEGRLQRQLVLYEQGLGLRDPLDFFEEITRHKLLKGALPLEQVYSIEQLEALSAAAAAWLLARRPERVCQVGDPQEGQILIPVAELKSKY